MKRLKQDGFLSTGPEASPEYEKVISEHVLEVPVQYGYWRRPRCANLFPQKNAVSHVVCPPSKNFR